VLRRKFSFLFVTLIHFFVNNKFNVNSASRVWTWYRPYRGVIFFKETRGKKKVFGMQILTSNLMKLHDYLAICDMSLEMYCFGQNDVYEYIHKEEELCDHLFRLLRFSSFSFHYPYVLCSSPCFYVHPCFPQKTIDTYEPRSQNKNDFKLMATLKNTCMSF